MRLEEVNDFIEEVDRRKEEILSREKEEGDYELACDLVEDLRKAKMSDVDGLIEATRLFLSIYNIQILIYDKSLAV